MPTVLKSVITAETFFSKETRYLKVAITANRNTASKNENYRKTAPKITQKRIAANPYAPLPPNVRSIRSEKDGNDAQTPKDHVAAMWKIQLSLLRRSLSSKINTQFTGIRLVPSLLVYSNHTDVLNVTNLVQR